MSGFHLNQPGAKKHRVRVTLHLMSKSKSVPAASRAAIQKIATQYNWDITAATAAEQQLGELVIVASTQSKAEAAAAEWSADLSTIRDLVLDPEVDNPRSECRLCGHAHTRWQFDLRNKITSEVIKTGSTCIEEYGLHIDGFEAREDALAALKAAISAKKMDSERREWLAAHPKIQGEIAELVQLGKLLARWERPEARWFRHLGDPDWGQKVKKILNKGRTIWKQFRARGFLTPIRTREFYEGVLPELRTRAAVIAEANKIAEVSAQEWAVIEAKVRAEPRNTYKEIENFNWRLSIIRQGRANIIPPAEYFRERVLAAKQFAAFI